MRSLERPILLSTLWIFVSLNYIYCDVLGLHDPVALQSVLDGGAEGVPLTPGFLLASSVLVEIPLAMVVVTRIARRPLSRVASIVTAAFMVLVQVATLFIGVPSLSYAFFSAIEIATLAAIGLVAIRWSGAAQPVAAHEVRTLG
ncbi:MAG: DUF6326 family protein [Pseudolysinimonas sp.]